MKLSGIIVLFIVGMFLFAYVVKLLQLRRANEAERYHRALHRRHVSVCLRGQAVAGGLRWVRWPPFFWTPCFV